jgi:hypothetical protein
MTLQVLFDRVIELWCVYFTNIWYLLLWFILYMRFVYSDTDDYKKNGTS